MALPPSGSDAAGLAHIATQAKASAQPVVVVCAQAVDALRLMLEIPFFEPDLRCALFPDWETLPYDHFSPHHDLISERLATLWRIRQRDHHDGADVVIVAATTALYRLAPVSFLAAYSFDFSVGQKLNEKRLREQLVSAGYSHVAQVMSPGEYSVRGGLIDLFPMGSLLPYRIDLFDDEIDSIRSFDPDTQRSLYPIPSVRLLPGREFPMDADAQQRFRARWREMLEGDPTKSRIYKDMGNGVATSGIEYYLPLFFDETATIFDYVGHDALVVLHGDVQDSMAQFWTDTQGRYRLFQGDSERPALPPKALFLDADGFYSLANQHPQLALRAEGPPPTQPHWRELPEMAVDRHTDAPLQTFKAFVAQSPRTLILAESEGRRESLLDYLRSHQLNPTPFDDWRAFMQSDETLGISVSKLSRGFWWQTHGVALVTETELFNAPAATRRRKRQEQPSDVDALIKDLSELQVGDPVVHNAHGIGRYRGLLHLSLDPNRPDEQQEFLQLEYAQEAVLYVPVSQLHLISRYTGVSADEAPLHRLGSGQWEKAKRKAAEQVRDTAAELLNIYARRHAREGHAFRFEPEDYERFVADFGFDETPDQQAAIHAVVQDMVSPRPMDRLVCGDVGFGKTEVALRAAFVAVTGGKQVAFLAPTTLLAEQHYQTLVDRFAKWPIKIAEMSRFRTTKEINAAIEGLNAGTVDIVVGTHKLLSSSVNFKNLGLLIIDEEHRFGVRHKEAMKALRAEVDVLTLTATPIPRTLGMALEGLRELSIIATAPQRRLAIKTFVRDESQGVIREAVMRELKRGGQVYFLHNEVDTIQNRRTELQALIPEARIAVAHGQMPERELEHVMREFNAQRSNLLLCSTIIETGIDVPTANTIIMARADKFGLAQLHQLRGRVGRSHHQAYAYLLVPDTQSLTRQAQQRLDAIQQMEELGSGFYLAMHDLEIRGAGQVLGDQQSGNIMEIGFQMYNDMLSQAVTALKSGKEPDLLAPMAAATDINLHAPALLPDDYCGDVHVRLSFYKKLATAHDESTIDNLLEELVDRFGKPPLPVQILILVHRLRVMCEPYGVVKVDATPGVTLITFRANASVDPAAILGMIQRNRHIKLAGNDKLRIEKPLEDPLARAQLVRDTLRQLGQPVAQES